MARAHRDIREKHGRSRDLHRDFALAQHVHRFSNRLYARRWEQDPTGAKGDFKWIADRAFTHLQQCVDGIAVKEDMDDSSLRSDDSR